MKKNNLLMVKTARRLTQYFLIGTVGFYLCCQAEDWTGWRGAERDAVCKETGLKLSDAEPKLLWEFEGVGKGYSSVAVVGNKLYTLGDITGDDGSPSQYLICIDIGSQKKLWQTKIGPPHQDGARGTPTVDGNLVFAIGTDGDLVCVNGENGEILWKVNLVRDLGGKMMSGWKFSESPLVDGDRVVVTPGTKDAAIAALDKKSGKLIWKTQMPNFGNKGGDGAGYSSIVISRACGIKQYVQILGRGCIGVAAEDGRFLWGYNRVANSVANIPTPVVYGDYVFCSTAYNTGSALLRLVLEGGNKIKVEEVYWIDSNTFQNHHGGFVKVGDFIYGGHGQNKGEPVCIEFMTGKIRWKETQPAKGSAAVLYADGTLIFRYDDGTVCFIEANPDAFKLKRKFTPPKKGGMSGPAWAHPVISNGKLYLRHNNVIQCFNVKGG